MALKSKQLTYTQTGYQSLLDELEYLKGTKRDEIKEAIAVAKSYGDLSENSEYDAARTEQAQVEARITELEELIKNAIVIDESQIDKSVVNIGSYVKVLDVAEKENFEYTIVGSNEVDALKGKISDQSPIGRALIGKTIGDTVVVTTPGGDLKLKLIEVTRK